MTKEYSDILTNEEVKLIHAALKLAYKPKLLASVEHKAQEIEKQHPLGSHGSVKAYSQSDGLEVEAVTINTMKNSKNKDVSTLGNKIYNLMINSLVFQTGLDSGNKEIQLQLIRLEDSSPMASSFKVARKLQTNGR